MENGKVKSEKTGLITVMPHLAGHFTSVCSKKKLKIRDSGEFEGMHVFEFTGNIRERLLMELKKLYEKAMIPDVELLASALYDKYAENPAHDGNEDNKSGWFMQDCTTGEISEFVSEWATSPGAVENILKRKKTNGNI